MSSQHWSEIAKSLRPRIESLRYGDRELGLKRAAAELGVSPQTLRRFLGAAKFVEQIEGSGSSKKLSLLSSPVAAIEYLARWHAYDPAGALKAAGQIRRGAYTVAAIGAAEKAARRASQPEQAGRSLVHECRERVRPILLSQFKALELDRRSVRAAHEPSVDFRFRAPGSTKWTVAAVIMGPYKDRSLYEIRLGDWIVKMLGLSMIYERIILVLPTQALKRRCLAWLRLNHIDRAIFEMQVILRKPV
jgi:hypothetical protein